MNRLIESGKIEEMECGENFAYILSDEAGFLPTEYKVFRSQGDGCFVDCAKFLYNGRIQMYYRTDGYRNLGSLIPSIDADLFLTIAGGLLFDVVRIRKNGFLSLQNIDLSFRRIYVDTRTFRVKLVYLPVEEGFFSDEITFENELRSSLVRLIGVNSRWNSPGIRQFGENLANGLISLEGLEGMLHGGRSDAAAKAPEGAPEKPRMPAVPERVISPKPAGAHSAQGSAAQRTGNIRLTATNAPERVVLSVDKSEYLIGTNPVAVDGLVDFNRKVSRVHCMIITRGVQHWIKDMESTNGTFVNKARLTPGQTVPIRGGDEVRLADSSFLVSVG